MENGKLKIKVTAPPEGGKANDAVRRLFSKNLKVSVSSVEIVKGQTSRDKIVAIFTENPDKVEKKLLQLVSDLKS
ncbi:MULTISPECIES: DUF167 domain-containing protein [unclassified Desulfurobacterium]|uniref:DUF167 domain-containing protein n=1 Tax=unclassified Desulfurobacterium TaxID=2639089 RepID=UPI001E4CBE8D|nr:MULTISPECIES: DUF167 domain-containing protein [unclassified Desulfurobacterium]